MWPLEYFRNYRSNGNNFADLDYGFAAEVFPLVSNQFRRAGGERGVELQHGFEIEVTDGVVVRGRARRERADTAIYLDADQTTGQKELACQHEVRAQVVVPVKCRPGDGGVQNGKTDHGLEIQVVR